nr:hypothetical protein DOP62_05650 [Synechococcus elongatus PCC 11801]
MKPHTFWKQLQHRRCSTQGLTLVETLIAVVVAGIVIGGAGYGLAAITAANRTEDARTERRMEMSRALEFISDEVKSARGIARDPAGELTVQSPSFSLPSGAQLLMVVNTPRASESIVYYLAPPPTNSVWQGPQCSIAGVQPLTQQAITRIPLPQRLGRVDLCWTSLLILQVRRLATPPIRPKSLRIQRIVVAFSFALTPMAIPNKGDSLRYNSLVRSIG